MAHGLSVNISNLDGFEGMHRGVKGSHVDVMQLGRGRLPTWVVTMRRCRSSINVIGGSRMLFRHCFGMFASATTWVNLAISRR